jgi:hypothetical protein
MDRRHILLLHKRLAPSYRPYTGRHDRRFWNHCIGMAPRVKDVIGTCFTSRWRLGKKKTHGYFCGAWESCCTVVHNSGRPLRRKSTKGASPNLNSAATEEGSRGIKDKLSMKTS